MIAPTSLLTCDYRKFLQFSHFHSRLLTMIQNQYFKPNDACEILGFNQSSLAGLNNFAEMFYPVCLTMYHSLFIG